jgi:hypothetical protein
MPGVQQGRGKGSLGLMFLFLALAAALSDILSGLLIRHPRINAIGTRYIVGFA